MNNKCTSPKDFMIALLIAFPVIVLMALLHNASPVECEKLNTENIEKIEKIGVIENDTVQIGEYTYLKNSHTVPMLFK